MDRGGTAAVLRQRQTTFWLSLALIFLTPRFLSAGSKRQAAAETRLLVQVGAFKAIAAAHSLAQKLRRRGYPAESTPGADFHRVIVGPFFGSAEAEDAVARLTAEGYEVYLRRGLPPPRDEESTQGPSPEHRYLDLATNSTFGRAALQAKTLPAHPGSKDLTLGSSTAGRSPAQGDSTTRAATHTAAASGDVQRPQPKVRVGERDSERGRQLLEDRYCTLCHLSKSTGSGLASDISRPLGRGFSASTMAAMLWNHGPALWQAVADRNLQPLPFRDREMGDLYTYFYALRYFDPPGDASRGKAVFFRKSCHRCHTWPTVTGGWGRTGTLEEALTDRVQWVKQMWDHGGAVARQMDQAGIRWSEFNLREMVDLMVYLDNLPGRQRRRPALSLRLGNSIAGEHVFRTQGCKLCHTVGPRAPGKINLLDTRRRGGKRSWLRRLVVFRWLRAPQRPPAAGSRSLSGLAAGMWNHGALKRKGSSRWDAGVPSISGEQMADLLAYLFERGYFFGTEGNERRGRRVFRKKGCGSCHSSSTSVALGAGTGAEGFSILQMGAALWSHDPTVMGRMRKQGIEWPTLTDRSVADLIEYSKGKILAALPIPRSSPEERLWVQVGAFKVAAAAASLAEKLKGHGYPVSAVPSADFHRVIIGPFNNTADAAQALSRLESEGYSPYLRRGALNQG